MLLSINSWSQNISKYGRFSIDYSNGCAPVTINLKSHDNFGNISRQYFYAPGEIETLDTFHTYTEPGIYKIIQFVGVDVIPKTDTLIFEVKSISAPDFNVFRCDNQMALIEINDTRFDYFSAHFSETDSVIYYPGSPSITHDFQQDFGIVLVKGYLNDGYPTCPDKTISFNLNRDFQSEITELKLSEPCFDQPYITLTIDDFDRNDLYSINYNIGDFSRELFRGSINQKKLNFPIDKIAKSESSICVSLQNLNACDETINYQSESCVELIFPEPLRNTYATFSGNHILIKLPASTSNSFDIYKKTEKSGSFKYLTNSLTSYTDRNPTFKSHQYKIIQKDTCGFSIDSIFVSAPILKLEDFFFGENRITCSYLSPLNQLVPIDSVITFYNRDSSSLVQNEIGTNLNMPGGLDTELRIRTVYSFENDIQIVSNEIKVKYELKVFVPGAFTPNNDGLNDELQLYGLPTNDFEIYLYDSWGKLIQRTNSNPCWNGKINGKRAPEGTYMYKLSFRLQSGEQLNQVGTFVLLKN